MQAFHKVFVIPVPDKGDPLMGMKYNRFSFYMFGSRKQFALLMTGLVVEGKYTEAELLGVILYQILCIICTWLKPCGSFLLKKTLSF